ncbi:MAG: sigma-70 family RNA polymerase sigma factor, partial [Hydrogenophaga sp.]|uniref:sigma-70 family RNA polymerase sigma factor n=1 Tax=Hydrogenophaga sp. TaxID=1904254 RepID=UPI004035421D
AWMVSRRLFTLAHHRLVDHWRTHKAHASLDAETDDGAALADTLAADSGFGPVRQLQSREQAQALLDALAALPLPQRETFLLQAEGGLSLAEIAQATGVNAETAKSRLRYARERLRQALEAFA